MTMRMTMAIAAAFVAGACSPSPTPTGEGAATSERAGTAQPQRPGLNHAAIEAWLAARFQGLGDLPYAVKGVDLNGDGRKEAIVYVAGSRVCVVGKCDAVVLTPGVGGYDQVMTAGNAELPISLLDSRTNGWRDLSARVTAGGGTTAARKLSFDRSSSRAANMLPEAEAQAGQVLIAETATLKLLGH